MKLNCTAARRLTALCPGASRQLTRIFSSDIGFSVTRLHCVCHRTPPLHHRINSRECRHLLHQYFHHHHHHQRQQLLQCGHTSSVTVLRSTDTLSIPLEQIYTWKIHDRPTIASFVYCNHITIHTLAYQPTSRAYRYPCTIPFCNIALQYYTIKVKNVYNLFVKYL